MTQELKEGIHLIDNGLIYTDGCLPNKKEDVRFHFPTCELCPLPRCRYEGAQIVHRYRRWRRDQIIAKLSETLRPFQVAKLMGLTDRAIFRSLQRVREGVGL